VASSKTSNATPTSERAANRSIKIDQRHQYVNRQYNIINAVSVKDLSSDAQAMLDGFVNVIDLVNDVDPNAIAEQVSARIRTDLQTLVTELQKPQPNTKGLPELIQRARAGIRESAKSVNEKYQEAYAAAAHEAAKQSPNATVIEKHLSTAKVFMAAAATLTIIAVDLMTTGGMITMLSLGYGAGLTSTARQTKVGVCPACGAQLH
jgi:hypothetical protein